MDLISGLYCTTHTLMYTYHKIGSFNIIKALLPFSAKRTNKPPKAVLRPAEQTIQLPTHSAIVDASDSSDDATDAKVCFS